MSPDLNHGFTSDINNDWAGTEIGRIEREAIVKAANALAEYGVTEQLIREKWQSSQNYSGVIPQYIPFTDSNSWALIFLISGQPPEVLLEIEYLSELPEGMRLTPEEAFGQINGLDGIQVKTLTWLYSYGLRAHHLRNWQNEHDSRSFLLGHHCALKDLVIREHRPVEEAINILQGKSEEEAWDIYSNSPPNIPHSLEVFSHPHHNADRLEKVIKDTENTEGKRHQSLIIPDEFVCLLSGKIIDVPVRIPGDPHAFEKSYLERWFKIKHINPITNEPCDPKEMVENKELKAKINNFISKYERKCKTSQGFLTAFWKRQNAASNSGHERAHSTSMNRKVS